MKKLHYLVFIVLLVVFIGPFVYLGTHIKLVSMVALWQHNLTFVAIKNTLILSFTVATVCLLIGFPLAWLVSRTDLPLKHRFKSWLALPYIIPPYIGAIAWISLANPGSGILNSIFGSGAFNIYSFKGLIFIESSFLFTFVFMTTLSALEKMDASLEESARISGANHFRVFMDITVPLLKPAMINGFLLVFLSTAASFGVPAMIGGPARLHFVTTQIYAFQRIGTENGLLMSIAFSSVLLLSAIILFIGIKLYSKQASHALVTGKTSRPSLIELGAFKPMAAGLVIVFLVLIFILPALALLLSAFSETQGVISFSSLNLNNFARIIFSTEETKRAFSNSFILSISSGLIITLLGFFVGYLQSRSNSRLNHWIEGLVNLPFATPGTVIAVSLILIFSQSFWGSLSLYNTLGLLLVAYILKFFSLSLKTITEAFSQIHPSLDEAARLSGASRARVLIDIYFPLLAPTLLATFFLVMMPCLSELTMTLLLSGPGQESLGVLIYQLQEYSDMNGGGAAVVSVMILTILLLCHFIFEKIQKRRNFA
jgi:iron(III) transport system permease protein